MSLPVAERLTEEQTAPEQEIHQQPGVQWLVPLLSASAFVVFLNETIMSVAIPRLMDHFQAPATSVQWLTTAFLLTMAVTIPVSGFILSRFTIRQVFIGAMGTFTAGTLLAALAPSLEVLIGARVIQALGTAQLMPLLMTTILLVVPEHQRGRTMGTIGIVLSVAPAVGPTVSGLILAVLDWRWMFWLVIPFALVSLSLGAAWIRNVIQPSSMPIDVVSVGLSVFGFGGLVYGLNGIGEAMSGHSGVPVWIPLSIGSLGLVLFIARQLQLKDRALLDLRAFTSSTFSIAVLLIAISMTVLFGSLILLPIFLQGVLEVTTLTTGLLLLPGGLTMGLLAPPVGRLYDRFGPRPLVVPGTVIISLALLLMSRLAPDSQLWTIVACHMTLSVGLALVFTPVLTSSLSALPQHLYSHGSAIVSTVQQVAGAVGTALFVTIMSSVAGERLANGEPQATAIANGFTVALTSAAVASAVAIAVACFVRGKKGTPVHA